MNDTWSVTQFLEGVPPDTCTQLQRNLFSREWRHSRLDMDRWQQFFELFLKDELEVKERLEDDFSYNPEACQGCGCEPGEGITEDCEEPLGCGYWKQWRDEAKTLRGRIN